MEPHDDDLERFEAAGAPALPMTDRQGSVEHDGARIWYTSHGAGKPVILLHGGFGNGGNWGYQVPALLAAGYRVVLVDSRGHGRSTRDTRPLTYERMAADVVAVMDALMLETAALTGWSDGAIVALIMAMKAPARVAGVFFFGGNMDLSGVKQIAGHNPLLERIFGRHVADYARLSPTPDGFDEFAAAVSLMMKTQPDYSRQDLAAVGMPVAIVHAEFDEFITREHSRYLAAGIPGAKLIELRGMSHFAPLQRPQYFNRELLDFLRSLRF